jgi:hypothetical protein
MPKRPIAETAIPTATAGLSAHDRNSLALASKSSLHFYERIRQVRGSKAEIAAGTLDDILLGSDIGDLPELEATFLRSGDEIAKLLIEAPGDPDIVQVLNAHDERRAKLRL